MQTLDPEADDMQQYQWEGVDTGLSIPPEQKLMRAIVVQAILDATRDRNLSSKSSRSEYNVIRRQALGWFKTAHFETICHLADLDPDFIRGKVMDNAHRYRKHNGQRGPKHAR